MGKKEKEMKWPELNYGDIIELHWIDILSDSRWHPKELVEQVHSAPCGYAGYFINEDEDEIRCMNTFAYGDGESDYIVFPKGVIQKIKVAKRNKHGS